MPTCALGQYWVSYDAPRHDDRGLGGPRSICTSWRTLGPFFTEWRSSLSCTLFTRSLHAFTGVVHKPLHGVCCLCSPLIQMTVPHVEKISVTSEIPRRVQNAIRSASLWTSPSLVFGTLGAVAKMEDAPLALDRTPLISAVLSALP